MTDPKRILYIDDDRDLLGLISQYLTKKGYVVETATDPATATRQLARIESFDVVLLDVSMPGVGGLDACRLLRGNKASKGKPIVLISAHDSPKDIEKGLAAGADRYLTKPVDLADLLGAIEELLAA